MPKLVSLFVCLYSLLCLWPSLGAQNELLFVKTVALPETVEIVVNSTDYPVMNWHQVVIKIDSANFEAVGCESMNRHQMNLKAENLREKVKLAIQEDLVLIIWPEAKTCGQKLQLARFTEDLKAISE